MLLAPHLPPDQKIKALAEALAAAKVIGDEGARAQALGSLAPHLPRDQIAEALAAAKAIGDKGARAEALGSLASYIFTRSASYAVGIPSRNRCKTPTPSSAGCGICLNQYFCGTRRCRSIGTSDGQSATRQAGILEVLIRTT
jgi:hypothetical protein